MPKELMISLLREGKNGEHILTILDMIASTDDNSAEPTLDEIEF